FYDELFFNNLLLRALALSVLIGIASSCIAVLLALLLLICPLFFGISFKSYFKRVFNLGQVLLLAPDIFIALTYSIFFLILGFKLGIVSLIVAHVGLNIPLAIIVLYPVVMRIERTMLGAAADLGGTPYYIFEK